MPPRHVTVHVALVPQFVMQPPPGQSTVHFELVPQLVVQPPPLQVTAQDAEVPQEVTHRPLLHCRLQLLDVLQLGEQLSLHSKEHFWLIAHVQLAPQLVAGVPDELPEVPEVPPSALPPPIVKS